MAEIYIAVPINEEKLYCIQDFLSGLEALVQRTTKTVKIGFAINSEDRGVIKALRDWHVPHEIVPVYRRPYNIPIDHIHTAKAGELHHLTNIVLARNTLREAALLHDCNWLFFIDADGVVEPNTLNEIIKHDLPVVTLAWAQRIFDQDANPLEPDVLIEHCSGVLYLDDLKKHPRLIKNAGHAFGACLIRQDVLQRFSFGCLTKGTEILKSEDYTFFHRLRQFNIEFGVDHKCRTLHMMDPHLYPIGWANNKERTTYSDFIKIKENPWNQRIL